MKKWVIAAVCLALVVAAVVALAGCESWAAQEERAAAERVRAEAAAQVAIVEANTQAAAERAAIREAARESAHGRTIEILPFVVVIAGAGLLCVMLIFVAWDLRSNRPQAAPADPGLVLLLERQDRRLAELERVTYHVIAATQRGSLASRGEVVLFDDRGRS